MTSWLADEAGVTFAVTAKMSASLSETIGTIDPAAWRPYPSLNQTAEASEERQWAEVVYVPDGKRSSRPEAQPFRYLTIRVRSRQGELLEGVGTGWRHFCEKTRRLGALAHGCPESYPTRSGDSHRQLWRSADAQQP